MLELLFLEFELLARSGDVHQGPTNLSDLVEHLLVGEVEHLVGLLGGVQRLVRLRLEDLVGSLEEGHVALLVVGDGWTAPSPLPGQASGSVPAVMPPELTRSAAVSAASAAPLIASQLPGPISVMVS